MTKQAALPGKETGTTYRAPDTSVWHTASVHDLLVDLAVSEAGLSSGEVRERRAVYGPNELPAPPKQHPLLLLLKQFTSLLIVILMIAAIVSAGMGEIVEAVAIFVIVVLAGVVGFIQEYRAERALEALQRLAAPQATVRRDGHDQMIEARDLVPGDIILLKTGDAVPADARILHASTLQVDESTLTGESLPAEKQPASLEDGALSLGDRTNMVYSGTTVQFGRGKALVLGTGGNTEFGKIASLLQTTETRRTPLQQSLDRLGKVLGIFSILLAAGMSVLGLLRGYGIVDMFIWGVAIAVAVIPEALPAVVTITLALGVRRMASRQALIRRLSAVETLGATSLICSDKTGTLTQNEMTVRRIATADSTVEVSGAGFIPVGGFVVDGANTDPASQPVLLEAMRAACLCNDAELQQGSDGQWQILGDPTEGALLVVGRKAGLDIETLQLEFPRIAESPFSSERKRMTTVHPMESDDTLLCSKGAPEVILPLCTARNTIAGEQPLTDEQRADLLRQAQTMASSALRVLAVAYKRTPGRLSSTEEDDLVFAGLFGIQDPPRAEVFSAIRTCEDAGIRPVMITGDHRSTAVAVATELGILKEGRNVLTGQDLSRLSDQELADQVDSVDVFARISPEHKLRIVNAFLDKDYIVAMTGDGVNDAPSLKRADIGVAMGVTGTDVSKAASDMILTDDNFATIVEAIREGRSIFQNIRKYLVFLLSGNMGTVLGLMIALLTSLPLPLVAVQVLFINFIMDGLIAIALGLEPPESGVMKQKPRPMREGMLNADAYWFIGVMGTVIGLVTAGVFALMIRMGMNEVSAMTMFFMTLVAARLFNALNCKSLTGSFFMRMRKEKDGPPAGSRRNVALRWSTGLALVLTLIVVYVPAFHEPFSTVPLTPGHVGLAAGAAALVLAAGEGWKAFRRSRMALPGTGRGG